MLYDIGADVPPDLMCLSEERICLLFIIEAK